MSDISKQIVDLAAEKNAVIIAHNYQLPEVQDIAAFTGDSLELSRKATEIDAEVIVFCGVHFMAETAAILNPERTVILPDANAGCPMADMITAEQLRELKTRHPQAKVVCYVNSSAEVKAESDCCCTSSNAMKVVEAMGRDTEIIFVPDMHLGDYVCEQLDREMILWQGYCPTHARIREIDILEMKEKYPNALVLAHPECPRAIRALAEQVLSTGQMCRFAKESQSRDFIIATELGINHRLEQENPGKNFHAVTSRAICPNMKKITLEKILWSLQDLEPIVTVEEPVRSQALKSIERMLEINC